MLDDSTDESDFKGTSRGWCFTIHDYTEEQLRRGLVWLETHECIGISAGLEIAPKTGSPHIQGYVRLSDAVKKTAFWKIIGPNAKGKDKWWIKKANADWAKNAKYTSKDENVIWHKVPPLSQQGARNDLVEFRQCMKRKPDCTAAEMPEEHLSHLAKYPRLRNELRMDYLKVATRQFRKVEVIVHWGDAGTGKTKLPYEESAYIFDDYEHGWWDGYDGESVICFDDFYGGIKYSYLLRLLDGYQMRLKIKGGFTYAQWSKIYITSNKAPHTWYKQKDGTEAMTPALERRITSIKTFFWSDMQEADSRREEEGELESQW